MQMFDAQAYNDEKSGLGFAKQIISFYHESVKQKDGSFENVEHIRIHADRLNEVCRPVTESDKRHYSARYEAFQKNEEVPPEGTPIKEWAVATPADISSCKAAKIHTIEQLADAPDEALQRNHLVGMKYKAIDFLRANKDSGVLGQLRDELEEAKKKIETLEEKNRDLIRANNDTSHNN